MDQNTAEKLAKSLLRDHSLDDWSFTWDRALNRFGSCNYTRHTITLSWYLVGLNEEEQVKDTILHEIAHVLAGPESKAHGLVWKHMAQTVGCSSNRCYGPNVAEPKAKWRGECPCGEVIKRQRRKRGLFHTICGGRFTWTENND